MEDSTLIATFDQVSSAVESFLGLISEGVLPADAYVISRYSYLQSEDEHGRRFEDEDQLMIFGEVPEAHFKSEPFKPHAQDLQTDNDLRLFLAKQGFTPASALWIEGSIRRGGAILVLFLPSGNLSETTAWNLIHRHNGKEAEGRHLEILDRFRPAC